VIEMKVSMLADYRDTLRRRGLWRGLRHDGAVMGLRSLARARARKDGYAAACSKESFFEECDPSPAHG